MNWIDYTVCAILVLSVLVGLWRGLIREVLSLAGWLLALFLAGRFAPMLALSFPQDFATPLARQLIAAIVIFLLVSLVTGLIALLVAKAVHAVGLGLIDRILGAIFGFCRGALIVLVCVVLAGLTDFVKSPAWQEARLREPLQTAAVALKPWLPKAIAEKLRYE